MSWLYRPPPRRPDIMTRWRIWLTDYAEPHRHTGRAYTGTNGELVLRDPAGRLAGIIAPGHWASTKRMEDTDDE